MGFLDRLGRERAGAPEAKSSEAARVFAVQALGHPAFTPRDYANLAREGYGKNVIVYRAVNEVAQAAASVAWRLFTTGTDEREEVGEHELLRLWEHPNPIQGRSEFLQNVVGFYLLSGNSYLEAVGPQAGAPAELWPLRPDRINVLPGATGLPRGYVYKVGGAETRWDADPVTGESPILHLRTFNPLNDWYGMSPIEAAALGIDLRNDADAWNLSLLQNSARPSGALVYKPKEGTPVLSPEQRAEVEARLDERFAGARNAGRPPVFDGALEWVKMGMSPAEVDWLQGKNTASRDIALAFGVPPQLLGIPGDNTYSNYQEARLALWEETVIPLLRMLRDEINNWLVPKFAEDLAFDVDLDDVPALALRRQARMLSLEKVTHMKLNEKRKASGLDDVERGDLIAGPNYLIIDGELFIPPTFLPVGAEPEGRDEEDEARGLTAIPEGGATPDHVRKIYRLGYGDDAA